MKMKCQIFNTQIVFQLLLWLLVIPCNLLDFVAYISENLNQQFIVCLDTTAIGTSLLFDLLG